MISREVPNDLQKQARNYLGYVMKDGNIEDEHSTDKVLNYLSNSLRTDIKRHVYLKTLSQIPFLKNNFSQQFLDKLALAITEKSLGPDEIVVQKNEYCEPRLIIVIKGQLELILNQFFSYKDPKSIDIIKEGQVVGAFEFFQKQPFTQFSIK